MAEAVIKKLPAPVVTGGKPLMETIGERKTIREFKAQNVDDQTLSEILWVAFGISHDGKRTIPTAMISRTSRYMSSETTEPGCMTPLKIP